MKSKLLLLLMLQTLFSVETMFAQITFQKTFGGTGDDGAFYAQTTIDGGYVIVGGTYSSGAGSGDVFLIKTDASANLIWTKTFGGINSENGYSAQQTTDGGFIITGLTYSFGAGNDDVYLIKTDTNGDSLWTKTFGGSAIDIGNSVHQTSDGGYIFTGFTFSYPGGSYDVHLVKTDVNGDTLWSKAFGGTNLDYGQSVQQTTDGGYIAVGTTYSFISSSFNVVYLIKTNSTGDILWAKTFGGATYNYGKFVQQTMDGGYIIAGITTSFGAGLEDVYLIKTDANGDTIWTKTFGGTNDDGANFVQQTTDGGYIITGYTNSFGAGNEDVYLIKTDSNGDTIWTKTFGGTTIDFGNSVQQTLDGGYVITGFTGSFGSGSYDVYLIKTDSLGNSGCNEGRTATIITTPPTQVSSPTTIVTSPPTIVTTPATIVGSGGTVTTLCTTVGVPSIFNLQSSIFNISPNPFADVFNITAPVNDVFEIILYDITSRKLLQQTFTNAVSINTSHLTKGMYVYEVRSGKEVVAKGKVVKE